MNQLRVVSIQRGCVYDGPGVRTTIFLKGCTMHCPWCCNPESISKEVEFYIDNTKCLMEKGMSSDICAHCVRKGGNVALVECPFGVKVPVSKDMDLVELESEILKDMYLYKDGGGITISGGEPLLHAGALRRLVERIASMSINVYIETTLTVPIEKWNGLMPFISGYIVDLKLQREMGLLENNKYIELLNDSLQKMRLFGSNIVYRLVFVDSVKEDAVKIIKVLKGLSVNKIELLKCHNLGWKKYQKLNLIPKSFDSSEEKMKEFQEILCEEGILSNKLVL